MRLERAFRILSQRGLFLVLQTRKSEQPMAALMTTGISLCPQQRQQLKVYFLTTLRRAHPPGL